MGKKSEQEIKALIVKLITYRHENRISQSKIAAMMNMERAMYAKIETYKRVPTIGFLRKASKIVGKSMEELCED